MGEKELTTVQFDLETDRKLRLVAQTYQRSKAAQIRFMVNAEYEKLATVNLPPLSAAEKSENENQA